MAMPGVVITTSTRTGPAGATKAPSGQYFVAGVCERGSTTAPILVRGMSDVTSLTGPRVTYGALYDNLKSYFDEGGKQAYIARVVGPSATKGYLTVQDQAVTPLNTIKFEAANAGSWSSNLTVEITAGSLSDTFKVIVRLSGTIVTTEDNIESPAACETRFTDNLYVTATDLDSATVAPDNNPAVIAATSLSAGDDDRANITATSYVTALGLFNDDLGTGMVAIPGQTVAEIWTGINTHCVTYNRVGAMCAASTASIGELQSRGEEIDSEYVGVFAPWIKVSDGAGGTRAISPEGYVAACRARAHEQVGPWRIPANEIAIANSVSDVLVRYSPTEFETLNSARISVIRAMSNTIRLYGWRSLSSSESYRHLKDRDMLNYLVGEAKKLLEPYVYSTIDGRGMLLARIEGDIIGMCAPIADKGGLYALYGADGEQIDDGYLVETGSGVNSLENIAQNDVNVRLSVRISPAAELITLNIVKTDVDASLTI